MVKLWSKNKTFPLRQLARIPVYNRLDEFELQILFESWIKMHPHLKEIYDDNGLIISMSNNELIAKARMSSRQYIMWCLKYLK